MTVECSHPSASSAEPRNLETTQMARSHLHRAISERTKAALAAAKRRGEVLGNLNLAEPVRCRGGTPSFP